MDEPWGHYTKWNKPVTKGQKLYDSTYMKYLKQSNSETQSRPSGFQGLWGAGNEKLWFNG